MNVRKIGSLLISLVVLSTCKLSSSATPAERPTIPPVERPAASAPSAGQLALLAPGNIEQVWANDGGDKVTRDEQHAQWINAKNIGKSQDEMIQVWNEAHPDNLIDD